MKANYQEPVVLFESFALNQTIAENCGVPGGGTSLGKPNHYDKSTCGWDMGNIILFVSDVNACTFPVPEDTDIGGYCYNTPTPDMQIFSS